MYGVDTFTLIGMVDGWARPIAELEVNHNTELALVRHVETGVEDISVGYHNAAGLASLDEVARLVVANFE